MWLYPTNITYFRRYTPFGGLSYGRARALAARSRDLVARDRGLAARDRGLAARNRDLAARNRGLAARNRDLATRNTLSINDFPLMPAPLSLQAYCLTH